jgi:cytochrome b6-f complex iron-sulfur subunit
MDQALINRKKFLMTLGITGGALLAVLTTNCLSGCSSNPAAIEPSPITSFTIDLSDSKYSTLQNTGGFVIVNQVVIAKVKAGNYVAVTQICSHQGNPGIVYNAGQNIFSCTVHGAEYDTLGKGLNANGKGGLTLYSTSLSGTKLTISM